MKYLNTYKLFESEFTKLMSDIKLDCEEILLELKDIGFDIRVRIEPVINNTTARGRLPLSEIDWVVVEINNINKFSMDDVSEYTKRLEDYLKTYNLIAEQYEILKEFFVGHYGNPAFGQDAGIVFFWQLKIFFSK